MQEAYRPPCSKYMLYCPNEGGFPMGGGGVPTFLSGGVPTFPGLDRGVPTFPGRGVPTFPGPDGGVPTFPGLEGYLHSKVGGYLC